jgi:hypothetical protein
MQGTELGAMTPEQAVQNVDAELTKFLAANPPKKGYRVVSGQWSVVSGLTRQKEPTDHGSDH